MSKSINYYSYQEKDSCKPSTISCAWFCPILINALKGVHKGVQDVPVNRNAIQELLEETKRIESKNSDFWTVYYSEDTKYFGQEHL